MTPPKKRIPRRRVVDFSVGGPMNTTSPADSTSDTSRGRSLADSLPRADQQFRTTRVVNTAHDDRPTRIEHQPVVDRPGPVKKPGIEWQPTPDFDARLERMREQAAETGCTETVEVMLEMVNAVEGFQRPGAIFRGPSKREIEAAEVKRGMGERDAREHLWREVNEQHARFDRADTAGASDWLRLLGTMQAAIVAEGNKPSVFEVQAPAGPGDRGNENWKRFLGWCIENHLDARTLVQTAERLKDTLGIQRRADVQKLLEQIEQIDTQQLDQVIMAGFGIDNLFVNMHGYYQRLEQVMIELDPQVLDERFEKARAARDEFARSREFWEERRKHGNHVSAAWDDVDAWRRRKRAQAALGGRLNEVWDQTYQAESQYTEPVLVSRQSAAYDRQPTACFIGLESVPQRERGLESEHLLGAGVHAVRAEVIGMLAGEDKLIVQQFDQRFDLRTGRVVRPESVRLLNLTGPELENRMVEINGEEATAVIANFLTAETRQIHSGHAENLGLRFVYDNHNLIETKADQWHHRSQGRLQQRENFDLNNWYQERLAEMGHPASVTALEQAGLERLALQPTDILECSDGDIETVITEIEKNFPEKVTIVDRNYPVNYHYEPGTDGEVGQLTAIISLGSFAIENPALLWTADQVPHVGPENQPLELGFATRIGYQTEVLTNLDEAQDALDWRYLEEQWHRYENRDWRREITIDPFGEFPDPVELVAQDFPDGPPEYATAKNGGTRRPYPAIQHRHKDSYNLVLQRTTALAKRDTQNAREMQGRRMAAEKKEQARLEQVHALDPERAQALRDAAEEIKTRVTEHLQDNPFAERLQWDVTSAANEVAHALHRADIEEAQRRLEHAQSMLEEQINKPAHLWQQARELFDGLSSKPYHFPRQIELKPDHLNPETYSRPPKSGWHDESKARPLPTTEQLEALVRYLEEQTTAQERRRIEVDAAIAARDAKVEAWEKLDQPKRRAEMEKFLRQAEAAMTAVRARVNKHPQAGLRPARTRFVRDVLTETQGKVQDRIRWDKQEIDRLRAMGSIETHHIESAERKAESWAEYDPGEFGHFNSIEQNLVARQQQGGQHSGRQHKRQRRPAKKPWE